jgi:hypothetical protein
MTIFYIYKLRRKKIVTKQVDFSDKLSMMFKVRCPWKYSGRLEDFSIVFHASHLVGPQH